MHVDLLLECHLDPVMQLDLLIINLSSLLGLLDLLGHVPSPLLNLLLDLLDGLGQLLVLLAADGVHILIVHGGQSHLVEGLQILFGCLHLVQGLTPLVRSEHR